MVHSYLVAEGTLDVELIVRLLRSLGLTAARHKADVARYWLPLIPNEFPHADDLLARVPVPVFCQSADHSIAVAYGGGDIRLVAEELEESMAQLGSSAAQLSSVGIIVDADADSAARFRGLRAEIAKRLKLEFADKPGIIRQAAVRTGIFVLPDNNSAGAVEHVLEACASANYPVLRRWADESVARVDLDALTPKDLELFQKPFGHLKATLGCIASVLKPGYGMVASVRDNRWLEGEARNVPSVALLLAFLRNLLQL